MPVHLCVIIRPYFLLSSTASRVLPDFCWSIVTVLELVGGAPEPIVDVTVLGLVGGDPGVSQAYFTASVLQDASLRISQVFHFWLD